MPQVMERSVAAPPSRRGEHRNRRRRPRVPTADVCFGTEVAAELVRLIDGGDDPNLALVSLAIDAVDQIVFPTEALRRDLDDDKVVVVRIDDDERAALRDLLLADDPPDTKTLSALRRRLTAPLAGPTHR